MLISKEHGPRPCSSIINHNNYLCQHIFIIDTYYVNILYCFVFSPLNIEGSVWNEEYDGPAAEDEVLEFIVNGEKVDVGIFNDIVTIYEFDKEIA